MQIHGLNKLTLLDYPGHIAATVFTGHCNFRCPFCQNSSLVLNPESQPLIPEEEVFSLLKKRTGILEGVCISGGEPVIQPDLYEFIEKIKAMNFRVKLDTNGSNPKLLKKLVQNNLLDMVSMDIKNSIAKYADTIGVPNFDTSSIEESADFLMTDAVQYEFRMTVVSPLHEKDDFIAIGERFANAKVFFLQQFIDSGSLVNGTGLTAYTKSTLESFADILKNYIGDVQLRGI